MTDLILILTTLPDELRADELATALVGEGLAACVNVHGPMTSTYRWQGRIERQPERQVVIKTRRAMLPAIEARLGELHPYELPELVVIAAEAGEAYGKWLREVTDSS